MLFIKWFFKVVSVLSLNVWYVYECLVLMSSTNGGQQRVRANLKLESQVVLRQNWRLLKGQ